VMNHLIQHAQVDIRPDCGRTQPVNLPTSPQAHKRLLHKPSMQSCPPLPAFAPNLRSPVAPDEPGGNEWVLRPRCLLSAYLRRAKTWICRSGSSGLLTRPSGPWPAFSYRLGSPPHEYSPPE